jgi:F420-non-reducing hydrogenase iron-sulfur subunit
MVKPKAKTGKIKSTKANQSQKLRKSNKSSKGSKKNVNVKRKKSQARSTEHTFEPRILAFCCNWCSYAGADLAGVSRIQYPPNVRVIRVMCTGRIEPSHIIAGFEAGADGVMVSGCHPGDCHYISGNLRAEEQLERMKKLFDIIGFDARRLRLQWVSAAEGQLFADYIKEFVELIKTLGPSPLSLSLNQSRKTPATKNTLIKSKNKAGLEVSA